MNEQEILEVIESMSEEQIDELMNTEFDEEITKEANAVLDEQVLADALFAFGAYTADREVEEAAGELDKTASENFDAAEAEISQVIEGAVDALGITAMTDEVELHKTAQAAAGIIFAGYTAQLEKIAEEAKAEPGKMHKAKEWMKAQGKKVGEKAKAFGAKVKASPGKSAAIAGGIGALGAGAYLAKRHMDKKSSELTARELVDMARAEEAAVEGITAGFENLEKIGSSMGEKMKKGFETVKAHAKTHGKHMAGAAAGGALAAHMAHKMSKKKGK
jgi:hypothetical protein